MSLVVFGNNRVAHEIFHWLWKDQDRDVWAIPEGEDLVASDEGWERPFQPPESRILGYGSVNSHYNALRALQPKFMFGCRSRATVSEKVLAIARTTNLHYGKLPEYAGCHPIPHAILNGDRSIWVTLHWMALKLDAGPIIAQDWIPAVDRTHFALYKAANTLAVNLFKTMFPLLNQIMAQPQVGTRRYYPASSIDWSEAKSLDPKDPLLDRKLRAYYFPPKQVPIVREDYAARSQSVEEAHFKS